MFQRTFRTIRSSISPRWLTDGDGGKVGYALDLVKDAFVQRAYLGLLARLPQNDPLGATSAPTDALTAMGRDRRVVRGIFDTDLTFALRLRNWLTDRPSAGAPFTLLKKLHEYTGSANGVSFRLVDNSGNWYSRSATGVETSSLATANWNWDGNTAAWSRFWVIIYPGTLWTDNSQTWGSAGNYGDGATTTWGDTTITFDQAAIVRALVADWKPDFAQCTNIILALDPASFNPASPEPDGNWGKTYKMSGNVAVPSRLATARYLDGV